jgi:hypothetical protein
MKLSSLVLCAAMATVSFAVPLSSIAADDSSPAATSDTSKTTTDKEARKQKKAACYAQANAQSLHGKARKSFVHDCMKK